MKRVTLMVVDDDPLMIGALQAMLDEEYDLVFVLDSTQAVARARAERPDLILLDVQMPKLTGFQVCEALKADDTLAHTPVIFLTAADGQQLEVKSFSQGAVDYCHKSTPGDIFRARIKAHLSLVNAKRLEESYRDAIGMLAMAGHFKDADTGNHVWRMAAYAEHLALSVGWPEHEAARLALAAPMHDTGKIGIPDAILKKAGGLTPDEWAVMRTHTTIGHAMLSRSQAPVFQLAATVAKSHHEKWDGSGYPEGLVGEAIPESARIIAVADIFDALTTRRPYKAPWSVEQACERLLELAGTGLDPRLVEAFLREMPAMLALRAKWPDPV